MQLAGHVEMAIMRLIGGLPGARTIYTYWCAYIYCRAFVIRKDVPPYVKAAREPMSYMGLNIVGLQRRGILPQNKYKLYLKYLTVSTVYSEPTLSSKAI